MVHAGECCDALVGGGAATPHDLCGFSRRRNNIKAGKKFHVVCLRSFFDAELIDEMAESGGCSLAAKIK